MMRGAFANSGAVTNYETMSLYNNGAGADLLVVWWANVQSGNVDYLNAASIQGPVGTMVGAVAPIITGDSTLSGTIYELDDANQIVPDLFIESGLYNGNQIFSTIPLAILQPGWSFVVQDTATGGTGEASFIWQNVHPEDLEGRPCRICEPELFIVQQQ